MAEGQSGYTSLVSSLEERGSRIRQGQAIIQNYGVVSLEMAGFLFDNSDLELRRQVKAGVEQNVDNTAQGFLNSGHFSHSGWSGSMHVNDVGAPNVDYREEILAAIPCR